MITIRSQIKDEMGINKDTLGCELIFTFSYV